MTEIAFRLTTSMELDEFRKKLDSISSKYIIGLEHEETNRHFQCFAILDYEDKSLDKTRYKVKKLYDIKDKSTYYLKLVKKDTYKTYCLKEGNYIYKGYTEEEIKILFEQSYEKPTSFKGFKKQLQEKYMKDDFNEEDVITQLIDAYIEWEIDFDNNAIYRFMTRLKLTKNPELKDKLAKNIISRLNKEF